MARLVFLPGMSGNADFWRPVADALTAHEAEFVNWPGLGDNPPDPDVHSYDDLVSLVVDRLDRPSVLVAQSMGGYVAVRAAAVARDRVTHLVLAVTSGGVDLTRFGAEDWRPGSRAAHPSAPEWAFAPTDDLSHVIRTIDVPVLLVWATHDPISPPGRRRAPGRVVPERATGRLRQRRPLGRPGTRHRRGERDRSPAVAMRDERRCRPVL